MRVAWIPVSGSSRIVAEAWLPERHTILVRFTDGVEWAYYGCTQGEWTSFTAPGQSRGQYIAQVLNRKFHGRWAQ